MRIDKLHLKGFMNHEDTYLQLPTQGVVLVTGEIGAGKSSLIEAVAYGVWGKTLRGTRPKGEVYIDTGTTSITRKQKSLQIDGFPDFETKTKAQKALSSLVPDFDSWRYTSVFSSSDAALFSAATDAERKRLLEQVLGIEAFDTISKAVREDLRAVEEAHKKACFDIESLCIVRGERNMALVMERDALQKLDNAGSLSPQEHQALVHQAASLDQDIKDAKDLLKSMRVTYTLCNECGQRIMGKLETAPAEHNLQMLESERFEVEKDLDMHRRLEPARKRHLANMSKLSSEIAQIEQELENTDTKELESEVKELEYCAEVFGLKGARALMLSKALKGLEVLANKHLKELSEGKFSLTISPVTEKKNGVVNAISFGVEGAGGGDYKGASRGERRVIDVAVLLALTEISTASSGQQPGTLWLDEVFDALGEESTKTAAGCIERLADSRCIVVITHNETLTKSLTPVKHLRIANGRIS